MRYTTKEGILRSHINEHKAIYFLITFLFTIGFIIGSANSVFLVQDVKQESSNYILNFVESLKTKNIDINLLCHEVLFSNIKPILCVWVCGLIVVGIPLTFIYIGFYGYTIGFTVTSVIGSLGFGKGTMFLIAALLPQEIIFIPLIFFMALNSINFSKIINRNIKNNLKSEIIRYILLLVLSVTLALAISLFQTYIGVKIVKGIMSIV